MRCLTREDEKEKNNKRVVRERVRERGRQSEIDSASETARRICRRIIIYTPQNSAAKLVDANILLIKLARASRKG